MEVEDHFHWPPYPTECKIILFDPSLYVFSKYVVQSHFKMDIKAVASKSSKIHFLPSHVNLNLPGGGHSLLRKWLRVLVPRIGSGMGNTVVWFSIAKELFILYCEQLSSFFSFVCNCVSSLSHFEISSRWSRWVCVYIGIILFATMSH